MFRTHSVFEGLDDVSVSFVLLFKNTNNTQKHITIDKNI